MEIGSTAYCMKMMVEATKGLSQRDSKGDMEDVLFLTVGFPQRVRKNLRWVLVQTCLVWLKPIQKFYFSNM